MTSQTLAARLFHKLDLSGGETACWLWTGQQGTDGYGLLKWQGRTTRVHRAAWMAFNGEIPAGLFVCHRCDKPLCANPAHLFLGTAADNNADRKAKGRSGDCSGEKNGRAKLSRAQVDEIRTMQGTLDEIAAAFGVGKSTIGYIRQGVTWSRGGRLTKKEQRTDAKN